MKKRNKMLSFALAMVMLMSLFSFQFALAADDVALTITGDGVSKETTFSLADLKAMKDDIVSETYSSLNNYPTQKIETAQGVTLSSLLKAAGIKEEATLVKVTASDGYFREFTVSELLKDTRYYYPNIEKNSQDGKKEVPAIVAFPEAGDEDEGLRLVMGQRAISEQTYPCFVKYASKIEVLTAPVEKWSAVTSDVASGSVEAGKQVTLQSTDKDNVKIHYTTDGSDPTVDSKMFNISASYWQPQLNVPITINETTTVKAIAIGPGKANSDITTFTYTVGGDVVAPEINFTDLADFEWAQTAIKDLVSKEIINGMGNNLFAPQSDLTRAQFAKIMVLALGQQPKTDITTTSFTDVASDAWHAGYVEKAVELGLLKGMGDNTFAPDAPLSLEQMTAIIVRAMGKQTEAEALNGSGLTNYVETEFISDWAKGYVEFAEANDLIEHGHVAIAKEESKFSFNGQGNANRAQAAQTVYLMLGK